MHPKVVKPPNITLANPSLAHNLTTPNKDLQIPFHNIGVCHMCNICVYIYKHVFLCLFFECGGVNWDECEGSSVFVFCILCVCDCVCVFAFVFLCMCRGKLDLQCLGECEGSGAADPAS